MAMIAGFIGGILLGLAALFVLVAHADLERH